MTTMTLKEVAQEMKMLCKGLEKAGVLPLEEE